MVLSLLVPYLLQLFLLSLGFVWFRKKAAKRKKARKTDDFVSYYEVLRTKYEFAQNFVPLASILIVGATSDIGREICHCYGKVGYDLILTSRNSDDLDRDLSDYRIRYEVNTTAISLDLIDFDSHAKLLSSIIPTVEGVVLVAGYLGEHNMAVNEWHEARRILDTNFTGAVSVLNLVAGVFEKRQSGWIIGISSVAGDRGRASNFYYGSSKAGFTAYLSGLRGHLLHSGVHVLTVKPGFVDTKMTEGHPLPRLLTAQPKTVAKAIYNAQKRKKNVLYSLGIWYWIMFIIKHIPESIFKKLKF